MSSAPIQTTFEKSTWGFDPDTQKWFTEIDGKRATSQDFETLKQRFDKSKAAKKAVHKETFEATVLTVKSSSYPGQTRASMSAPVPTKIKVEWDAKKEMPTVTKYKILDDNSGWKEWDREKLLVVGVKTLPACLKTHYQDTIFNNRISLTYKKAEIATALAWIGQKKQSTQAYTIDRNDGLKEVGLEQLARVAMSHDKRNHFKVHGPAPFVVEPLVLDAHTHGGWNVTNEGHWQRTGGQHRVRLTLGERGTWPEFLVEEKQGDGYNTLFKSRSMNEALLLAAATESMAAPNQALPVWISSDGNVVIRDNVFWPVWGQVRGSFLATHDGKTGVGQTGTHYTLVKEEKTEWAWKAHHGGEHTGLTSSFFPTGPEDAVISFALQLRDDFQSLLRYRTPQLHDELKKVREEFLADFYEASLNGEWEETPAEALVALWERQKAAWVGAVESSEAVATWDARCAQAVVEVTHTLETLQPAAPRRRAPGM